MISFFHSRPQSLHKKNKLISFKLTVTMINYILLYKIRKKVKRIIKEKITDEELATTEKSCIGCVADEISWEVYYLLKENKDEEK